MSLVTGEMSGTRPWHGLINAYRQFLPVSDATPIITLNEGNTPLIPSASLSERVDPKGRADVRLKFDGANPTGSFKDRGMTMAISKAAEDGCKAVICASTGNTSASAAAYATRAGMRCIVLIPKGNIALGKLSQAMLHGADVFEVDGNFDGCLNMVRAMCDEYPVTLVNSVNPYRIQGQKTAAFELIDQLGGRAPDVQCMPVGNAGNITAYWLGYTEAHADGRAPNRPIMCGFQARGANPIVRGEAVPNPETIATAIRIGNPASWKQAEAARDESGGLISDVSDDDILAAYKMIAERDGVFAEPASAASVAGLLQASEQGTLAAGQRVVCTVTGNGLKDPDWAISGAPRPVTIPVDADVAAKALELT
jgi:threonine synthase